MMLIDAQLLTQTAVYVCMLAGAGAVLNGK